MAALEEKETIRWQASAKGMVGGRAEPRAQGPGAGTAVQEAAGPRRVGQKRPDGQEAAQGEAPAAGVAGWTGQERAARAGARPVVEVEPALRT